MGKSLSSAHGTRATMDMMAAAHLDVPMTEERLIGPRPTKTKTGGMTATAAAAAAGNTVAATVAAARKKDKDLEKQRAFRARKAARMTDLEDKVARYEVGMAKLQADNARLQEEVSRLAKELQRANCRLKMATGGTCDADGRECASQPLGEATYSTGAHERPWVKRPDAAADVCTDMPSVLRQVPPVPVTPDVDLQISTERNPSYDSRRSESSERERSASVHPPVPHINTDSVLQESTAAILSGLRGQAKCDGQTSEERSSIGRRTAAAELLSGENRWSILHSASPPTPTSLPTENARPDVDVSFTLETLPSGDLESSDVLAASFVPTKITCCNDMFPC